MSEQALFGSVVPHDDAASGDCSQHQHDAQRPTLEFQLTQQEFIENVLNLNSQCAFQNSQQTVEESDDIENIETMSRTRTDLNGQLQGNTFMQPCSQLETVDKRSRTREIKALYCTDNLWMFVTPGLTLIVIGFLLCFIYFSIRALTTSLEYTETVPTYANAILVLCAGILTISICKRRNKILIVTMITMCVICCLLCTASGILTGIRNIQVMNSIEFCQYQDGTNQCHCYTYIPPYKPSNRTSWVIKDTPEFVFYQSPSCEVITTNLVNFMYTQCALYGGTVVMCFLAILLGGVVYKNELKRSRLHEDEQEDYSMCTIISNRSAELHDNQASVAAGADGDASDHAPSLFSQRITFPGENQPRLLGIRRNDSIVGGTRTSDGDPPNSSVTNQYASLPNLPSHVPTPQDVADGQNHQTVTPQHETVQQSGDVGGNFSEVQANMENETRDRNTNRRSNVPRSETNNLSQTLDSRQLTAMWGMFVRYLQQMGHTVPNNSLPDYPLHRGAAAETMPNRPIRRQSSHQHDLPPWPVSRQNSNQNFTQIPLTRSRHQSLGNVRTRPSRNTVTSQRNSSLRDPRERHLPVANMSYVHYLTGVSNLVTYEIEPPPPYAQPPPYLENDVLPDYTSNCSTQRDQESPNQSRPSLNNITSNPELSNQNTLSLGNNTTCPESANQNTLSLDNGAASLDVMETII